MGAHAALRNALTRQAVYSERRTQNAERRTLHRTIAETIEQHTVHSSILDARLVDLAYHFYAGEVWSKAFELLGEFEQARGDYAQALPSTTLTRLDKRLHVRFQQLDASHGLPEQYDVITTFDVVHDAADPRGLLQSIRKALRPDGRYLCLEIDGADTNEGNAGIKGA